MYQASLFLLCYLINTRFAAAAASGTAAGFFYAEKLYEPLATALIYSVGIVLFPTFSHKYAQLSPEEYRGYVIRVLKDALLFLLPLSALLAAFGVPIIRVLFEGGDFTMADALACGEIFTLYALGLGGFFILDLLGKAYYAMGTPLRAVRLTSLALGICGGSNLLFAASVRRTRPCWPWAPRWVFWAPVWWRTAGLHGRGAPSCPGRSCFWAAGYPWAWELQAGPSPASCWRGCTARSG